MISRIVMLMFAALVAFSNPGLAQVAMSDDEIRAEMVGKRFKGQFVRSGGETVTIVLHLTDQQQWIGKDWFNPPKTGGIKTEEFAGSYNISRGQICKRDRVTKRNGESFSGQLSNQVCFPVSRVAGGYLLRNIKLEVLD